MSASSISKDGAKRKKAPIPTSWESASETDKLIIRLREEKRNSWGEIAAAWTAVTREKTKGSSIAWRYARLKENFMTLSEGDDILLISAEAAFEAEIAKMKKAKWERILEAMKERGSTEYYTTLFLQKKYEEFSEDPELLATLMAKATAGAKEEADKRAWEETARQRNKAKERAARLLTETISHSGNNPTESATTKQSAPDNDAPNPDVEMSSLLAEPDIIKKEDEEDIKPHVDIIDMDEDDIEEENETSGSDPSD